MCVCAMVCKGPTAAAVPGRWVRWLRAVPFQCSMRGDFCRTESRFETGPVEFSFLFNNSPEYGVWRRRMNYELAELYGGPSILTVANAGRIRWLWHVMRMAGSTEKVFDSDPQFGIRCRGAQRTRWLAQVKRELSEIWCLHGWEAAARDRASWRIVVDRAMLHRRAIS